MGEALLSLADAVEALSGPCRETDALIWRALGHCVHEMRLGRVEVEPGEYDTVSQCVHCGDYKGAAPPKFSASIDSAMSLVPANYPSRVVGSTDDGRCYAALAGNDMHMMAEDPEEFYVGAEAATYALALTAASLRALAQPTVTQP